ncbi:hypothetical protein ABID56_002056 [Alkalibacillus flavidus]|uniref:Glyoxalase-like domain-containing protein n=1 Tax=Alkalibacillus flavidus TaxID=546021 RepID=A0ABV2KZ14_9BACI
MTAFDHLVVHSFNPDVHQQTFSAIHQLKGVPGGQHEHWGTFNHLAFMTNDCYIEWLGVEDETIARHSDNPLIQTTIDAYDARKEGPIQFALRVDDLNGVMERLRHHHIAFSGPFPGSRTKPDGSELAWRMLFPHDETLNRPLPFLIEWDGDINRPSDATFINPTSFSSITVGTDDPERYVNQLQTIAPEATSPSGLLLDNGTITIEDGDHLTAHFESITFK